MTWTYDGAPGTGSTAAERDAVRFLVGDTDSSDPLVTDEEIGYALDTEGGINPAAAVAARAIAAKFSRQADKEVGDLSIKLSQKAAAYTTLAKKLTAQSAIKLAVPFAGGISIASKKTFETNTDRVEPSFYRDMHDYPGSSLDDAYST